MASESRVSVIAAIVSNLIVAILKFVAAAMTGSSAMISEGIHSLVDTGDGCLLFMGLRLSERPADAEHPFGHGRELYVWTLVVGVLIFGLGGGMSVWEGVDRVIHPGPVESFGWSYGTLGAAFVVEGISWVIAYRTFARTSRGRGFWRTIRATKDPSVFTILLEDSAAVIGVVIAALGLGAVQVTGNGVYDGVASVLIGLLLASVAVVLTREARGLLVGESADAAMVTRMKGIAAADPDVASVSLPKTMQLGADEFLAHISVTLRPEVSGEDTGRVIDRVTRAVRKEVPSARYISIEVQADTQA